MKILIAASTLLGSGDVPFFGAKAFNALGHETRLISPNDSRHVSGDIAERLREYSQYKSLRFENYSRLFMREVRAWKPDLTLVYGSNSWFAPEVLEQVKKMGSKVILWEENNRFFDGNHFRSLLSFDHIFVLDSYFIPVLRSVGVKNVSHLRACVDPDECFPLPLPADDPYVCDISFLGSLYSNRLDFFKKISHYNYHLSLYVGSSHMADADIGKFVKPDPVLGITKTKIFSNSKISVNMQGPSMINAENYRVFEVAACKGVSFSTYKPDLIQSFTPDKEVILFESVAEFNEKVKYYLAHPDELKQIGESAYRRALSDHGYDNRVREILTLLDMN